MGNLLIAANALTSLLSQALQLHALMQTAKSENRDLTAEELAGVLAAYQAAHTQLDQDITAAMGPQTT